jgi:hypothetical protein
MDVTNILFGLLVNKDNVISRSFADMCMLVSAFRSPLDCFKFCKNGSVENRKKEDRN